ncbi:hypothetical protein DFS33DRAFT_1258305 [Desarmillaria ectypa]|nr:hypothetical protein DFS33DRAFT_1258305 [Desarmillaria ectypa]
METALIVFLLLPALAISLAVTVPLMGILVRFRANYTPKSRITFDEENAAPTGPGAVSRFNFLASSRIHTWVWRGGYIGLMYGDAVSFSLALFTNYRPNVRQGIPQIPPLGIVGTAVAISLSIIMGMLLRVIVYRSMVTPHDLSVLHLIRSWNALLVPTLFPSGLLSTTATITVTSTVVFGPIRNLLLTWANQSAYPISNLSLALYYILAIVFTIIVTPLDVIATRLAVQGSSAVGEAEENSLVGEMVVTLRDPEWSTVQPDSGMKRDSQFYIADGGSLFSLPPIFSDAHWLLFCITSVDVNLI